MNGRSNIIGVGGDTSYLLKIICFIAFLPLASGRALAQAPSKATGKVTGEVVSANQMTINGFPAISGMTVFSDNRIKTGNHGAAIINLGKLGRIEFGADADMTLRFAEAGIGGELRSNRLVVSARAGIPIIIITARGVVTTDGRQPSALTIYVDSKRANVIAHLGSASVVPNGENSSARGKEISQSPRGASQIPAPLAAGLAVGATTAASAGQNAGRRAIAAPRAPAFTGLFKAGVNYSIRPESDVDPKQEELFETSMTCRDNDNKPCRKKSDFKPKRLYSSSR